ncbi:hypothetical protein ACN38_g6063 [Penicillium nordicum]|uniref:Uncharacterized protein n=1 Tax=Penicillium nordicum TaxID=229535 RepID=A0A0M8P7S6_9EURO|nr:hypothetical protein ACN38_g6063 [Penicillium nordicum]
MSAVRAGFILTFLHPSNKSISQKKKLFFIILTQQKYVLCGRYTSIADYVGSVSTTIGSFVYRFLNTQLH